MIDRNELLCACDNLFNTEHGRQTASLINKAIFDFSMESYIKSGVLVGFSGGADSVLLLIFFRKLQKEQNFKLKAIHINHMIRGTDADSDEEFSREFCEALEIDFESYRIDVPKISCERKRGLEEVARDVRYEAFNEHIDKSSNLGSIAIAHNATDNAETLIFNLMRGSGLKGLCGISPTRDNIFRPLIFIPKSDITQLLTDAKIPFVTDKTNFSVEYTRNYIRHEILPRLCKLSPSPEKAISRVIKNLSADAEYLSNTAKEFILSHSDDGKISVHDLSALSPAILSRVVSIMIQSQTNAMPEQVHIEKIIGLISKNNSFRVDLPGGVSFFSDKFTAYVDATKPREHLTMDEIVLNYGFNEIPELGIGIAVSNDKNTDFSSNVYNFSIQADLYSAIIFGKLCVRTRKAGDAYFYGGIRRRVKKLFCDRKIRETERDRIPIICDDSGIIWIPGFGVRCDGISDNNKHLWISIYKKRNPL